MVYQASGRQYQGKYPGYGSVSTLQNTNLHFSTCFALVCVCSRKLYVCHMSAYVECTRYIGYQGCCSLYIVFRFFSGISCVAFSYPVRRISLALPMKLPLIRTVFGSVFLFLAMSVTTKLVKPDKESVRTLGLLMKPRVRNDHFMCSSMIVYTDTLIPGYVNMLNV